MIHEFPEKYFNIRMDNLYNLLKLARTGKKMDQKVKSHGVVRCSDWGVPMFVVQKEAKIKGEVHQSYNIVKATVVKSASRLSVI